MKNILLGLLIIYILNVDCGLLNDVLTPVTEKAQNNALLDEHAHKEKEAEKKGLVTNVVEGLDSGLGKLVDPLTNLLNQGNKNKIDKSNPNKTEELPNNDTKGDDNKKTDMQANETKDVSKNTVDTENLNKTKSTNEVLDTANGNLNATTPTTDAKLDTTTEIPKTEDCTKENNCTEKTKGETDKDQVDVTRRVNFDGNQCPTGTERAHDDTCKKVQ